MNFTNMSCEELTLPYEYYKEYFGSYVLAVCFIALLMYLIHILLLIKVIILEEDRLANIIQIFIFIIDFSYLVFYVPYIIHEYLMINADIRITANYSWIMYIWIARMVLPLITTISNLLKVMWIILICISIIYPKKISNVEIFS